MVDKKDLSPHSAANTSRNTCKRREMFPCCSLIFPSSSSSFTRAIASPFSLSSSPREPLMSSTIPSMAASPVFSLAFSPSMARPSLREVIPKIVSSITAATSSIGSSDSPLGKASINPELSKKWNALPMPQLITVITDNATKVPAKTTNFLVLASSSSALEGSFIASSFSAGILPTSLLPLVALFTFTFAGCLAVCLTARSIATKKVLSPISLNRIKSKPEVKPSVNSLSPTKPGK
mmetsp:Transcript_5016/g.8926  ORF Transcript_5016/g.8926 Transcript_5016/m.8926 type:complete len:236 (+) Transcript_5016:3403-4110(+)